MSDGPLLEVHDLCTFYSRSQVLFDLSLKAPHTGAVAILGRNGAGKTTLLQSIAGELRPRSGRIVVDGEDCTRLSTERRARRGLGYVPQEHAVFSGLSVRENLAIGALGNPDSREIDQSLSLFPKLADRLDQIAGTLSGGERKMLAIGRALLGQPKLLLLDEPTEGVWIGVIEEIAERLAALSKEMALVIVEQHMELAFSIADYAYVIDRGEVAIEGTADEVQADPGLLRLLAPERTLSIRLCARTRGNPQPAHAGDRLRLDDDVPPDRCRPNRLEGCRRRAEGGTRPFCVAARHDGLLPPHGAGRIRRLDGRVRGHAGYLRSLVLKGRYA